MRRRCAVYWAFVLLHWRVFSRPPFAKFDPLSFPARIPSNTCSACRTPQGRKANNCRDGGDCLRVKTMDYSRNVAQRRRARGKLIPP